jgi:hypothetical protein
LNGDCDRNEQDCPLVPYTRCSRTTDPGEGTGAVPAPLKRAGKNWETHPMQKLILAATALAFLCSTASAQTSDKAGGTAAPGAQSTDTMSKGDAPKTKMASKKKSKAPAEKSSDDAK